MKKLLFLLALLTVTTASIRADIVIRCNQSGVSFDDKQIVIEGVYYEFHPSSDMFIEYLAGNPTAINISGGYFEVVGHDENLPSEINLREKIEPYQEDDKKFFSAYFEKQTGDGQIQKTPLNIKFNNLNSDFSSDFFFPVTRIGEKAFYECSGLISVTIPTSITTIGYRAFENCSSLTSVTIPNSVTSIGAYAFLHCSGLTSVHIIDLEAWYKISFGGYHSNPLDYAHHLFLNGKEIKDLVIPNFVTTIGNFAFDGCSGLTSVNIPNSVTTIGEWAFSECSGLTSVTIPNSVTTIGEWAFDFCHGLTSVTIPNSVTSLGNTAFCWCFNLNSIIVENGNSVYDSRDNCNAIIETESNTLIAGCMNTIIPKSIISIGDNAFLGCTGLTSVSIPNSVTAIGDYAFDGCYGLTSVTIPNSVTFIGSEAFYGCSGLTEIYSMISDPFATSNCWKYVNKDIPLYVPAGCKAKYEATPGWNDFTNIVEIKETSELEPIDESDNTDYGNGDIDDTTELNGNAVGNIYYNIADENGAYSSSEGCIILKKPTTDSSVEGTDIFGEEFKNNFTGIIFKVHAGSGTIKVNAEAIGNMILKVKVGNNAPLSTELQGKMKAIFPYTVSEESYVYIYGGESSSVAAKGTRAADTESVLKIYGIEWSETYEPSGIESLNNGSDSGTVIYNLSGLRVKEPTHGVYVKNGRKVIVK